MKLMLKPLLVLAMLSPAVAAAHVSVSGPGFAGTTHEATFGFSHGCDGFDTYRVRIEIPEGVTGVRPLDGVFGKATVEKDPTSGEVKAVTWTRPEGDVHPADTHYHQVSLRAKLPDTPFRTLYFKTIQYCRDGDDNELQNDWVGTSGGGHDHGGHGGGEEGDNPAPALLVLPPRMPGWNEYTLTDHVHDLSVFRDALIVWSGKAAYSPNPATMKLIRAEPDVEELFELHPGMTIWVKY